jgi:hypothetical protein
VGQDQQLSKPGFEALDLFAERQILLLWFFIALVEAVHLRGNFTKSMCNLISKRANFALQFLSKKQTQSFILSSVNGMPLLFITSGIPAQLLTVDKTVAR